jgi:hypothetical protein
LLPLFQDPNKPKPLIADLYDILERALIQVLQKIQKEFTIDGQQHQLFLALTGSNIPMGIRTQNFSIRSSARLMANQLISDLMSFVDSNEGIHVSSDFGLNVVVLSLAEINDRSQRGAIKMHHISVHSPPRRYCSWLVLPIEGHPKQPDLFKNQCLPQIVIWGSLLHKAEPQSKEYKQLFVRHSWRARPHVAKKICDILLPKMEKLKQSIPLLKEAGPYNLSLLNDISKALNVQCVVYFKHDQKKVAVFPKSNPDIVTGRDKTIGEVFSTKNAFDVAENVFAKNFNQRKHRAILFFL